jgi:molybdate-binding protein
MDVGTSDSAPTEAEQIEFKKLKRQTDDLVARWSDIQHSDLTTFQKLASSSGFSTVVVAAPGLAAQEESGETR